MGLELNGLHCVGHSEISSTSEATYRLFFDNDTTNYGDLMLIDPYELPDFDMMVAGFPCQTFSIAGKRAGFEDERGNIIYGLIKILRHKRPITFLLENVKGLVNHDKGRTFKIIQEELLKSGYTIFSSVLNSADYGVPQQRERIYIVGFRDDLGVDQFLFPRHLDGNKRLEELLVPMPHQRFDEKGETFNRYLTNKYNEGRIKFDDLVSEDYTVIDTRHSDLRIYRDATPTLRTGRHGILYALDGTLWKLSGIEALQLQGFRDEEVSKFVRTPVVSNNVLLSQAGNAMTVNVIQAIGRQMLETIKKN